MPEPWPLTDAAALWKVYDRKVEAVRGLDLDGRGGEFFGLLGPNGAGKTTTIGGSRGAPPADPGRRWRSWESGGGAATGASAKRIGISLQETRLAEKLTVRETLRLFRSFYPLRSRAPGRPWNGWGSREKEAALVAKHLGGAEAAPRLGRLPSALVGRSSEFLFLDEPTTGLDPQSRRQL